MNTKNMIWAALSMTAALVMTACSNDDNTVETPAAPQAEVKTIPYSVTVNGSAGTRATVDNDMKTLKFAAGDKLYIIGMNISGVLTLKSGDEGKSSGATFEGDLAYTGEGSPASNLQLAAMLVGTNNKGWKIVNGKVTTFSYPDNAYCSSVNDAVEQYSNLTGTSTYSAKSFTLTQQTAFLNFEITFVDGTTTGTTLSTVVSNNGSAIAIANVTTTTVGEKVVAKFVLPVDKNTALSGATVKMGNKAARAINDATLDGKVYNVKKTQKIVATSKTLATSAVGDVIDTNGNAYTLDDTHELPSGVTAVAIVAYKGSETGESSPYTHGLAIAMKDAGNLQWKTSTGSNDNPKQYTDPASAIAAKESGSDLSAGRDNSTWPAFEAALHNTITTSDGISAAAPASGTSGWFLPSLYQWNMIVKGLSGKTTDLSNSSNDDYKASSLNTKITAAGGDGLQNEGGYLSSTEYNEMKAWGFDAYTGGVGNDIKGNGHYVRSAFAF